MFSFRLCSSRDLCTKEKENYMIRESVTEWSGFAQHSEEETESFFAPVFKYQFPKLNLMETLTLFFLLLSNLYQFFLSLQLNSLKAHWQMCFFEIICPEIPVCVTLLPSPEKKNLLTGVGISCDFPVSQILNEILKPVRLLIHWSIWSPNFPQTVYFSLLAAQEIQLPFTGSLDFIDVLRSTLCFQMSSGSAQDLLHSLLHLSFISFSIFSSE